MFSIFEKILANGRNVTSGKKNNQAYLEIRETNNNKTND